MKKTWLSLLTILLLLGVCTACGNDSSGQAQHSSDADNFLKTITAETAEAKGVCGADLVWYYQDGVLVIKGTGDMLDWGYQPRDVWRDTNIPWFQKDDKGNSVGDNVIWLIVDEGVTSLGNGSFGKMGNLTKVQLPDTLVNIGEYAFGDCDNLKEINLPNSLTTIGAMAFYNCGNLKEINLPNSLTTIGSMAFENCNNLEEINLPNFLTTIGSSAFSDCKNLKEINLPNSLTTIGTGSFYGCESLTEITIPASVKQIEYGAFLDCKNLANVTFLGDAPEGLAESGVFDYAQNVYYSGDSFADIIANIDEILYIENSYGQIWDYLHDINWVKQ